MERFEEYLRENLPEVESFHPHYNRALAQILLAGGKRFRPMLLLSVVEAYEATFYFGGVGFRPQGLGSLEFSYITLLLLNFHWIGP